MQPQFHIMSLCLLLAVGMAEAQGVYNPPADQPSAQPGPATDTFNLPQPKPAASPLGQEIPLLDPAAETIRIGGVTIPLGDHRLLRARFEKFLSQPPESDAAAAQYRQTIAGILDTLSPFHQPAPNLQAAFKLLPRAATYPGDANICSTLAEAVDMAILAKQENARRSKLNDTLEQEKLALRKEADWNARHEKAPGVAPAAAPAGRGGNRGPAVAPGNNPGAGMQSLKYADAVRRIAEIELLKKANLVLIEARTLQTKTQYQANMVQWFILRRFEHVIVAARFYNQLWKDGDAALHLEKGADVDKWFAEGLGVSPTVSSLDSLSNEAISEAGKYIEAFKLMLARDELYSASQRLMEAFVVGEFLDPVATLPLEQKLQVLEYTRTLNECYGTFQARDYTKAKELAERLKTTAKDFPSSKMDAAIAGSTLASDLAIEEAKVHLRAGDQDKAAEKIHIAAEIWPTNPRLAEFRKLIADTGRVVTARNDFDRLLSEGNYREIAKREYELVPVIQGDAKREEAFKQIRTHLATIEAALGKAAEFGKLGQNYAAWEQLAALRAQFPDDPKLGRELELLAPKVADFTKSLDRAQQFENRTPKQTGSALAWYLKARHIYPRSHLAETGIKRLLDDILAEDTPETAGLLRNVRMNRSGLAIDPTAGDPTIAGDSYYRKRLDGRRDRFSQAREDNNRRLSDLTPLA
ncbi:MAG: hypothetical protein NTW21_10385 [Verrucomicrobia bacterium]|nr:hypothetical protein [Verrucomicrobiota bacterium]